MRHAVELACMVIPNVGIVRHGMPHNAHHTCMHACMHATHGPDGSMAPPGVHLLLIIVTSRMRHAMYAMYARPTGGCQLPFSTLHCARWLSH